MKPAKVIYAENLTWEQSEALKQAGREKLFKWGAISGWSLAILCTLSVSPLMHFQHIVATAVVVDHTTGDYRVERDLQSLTVGGNSDSNQRYISDLSKYVKAREGFSRAEADNDYKTVWLMDSNDLRGPWDNYYKPDLNKFSPVVTMQAADSWTLTNFSFTFLPTSEPGVHLAQVRYDLVKKIGQLPTTSQRMVSTVTFKYDPQNIPTDMDGMTLNAFGFVVVNYRRDDDGPVHNVSSSSAQVSTSDYAQPGGAAQYSTYQPPTQGTPQPAQIARGNVNPSVGSAVRSGLRNLIGSAGGHP